MRRISLILLSISLLLFSLCGCSNDIRKYSNSKKYQVGNQQFHKKLISKVVINWISSEITIEHTDDFYCYVKESNASLPDEKKLHTYLDESTGILYIQFCQSGYIGEFVDSQKKLIVLIPQGIEVEINTETAILNSDKLIVDSLKFESISGSINVKFLNCDKLTVKTETGNISIVLNGCNNASIKTETGDSILTLDDLGATISFKSKSGEFITKLMNIYSKGKYIFEEGTAKINYSSSSANLTIK